MAGAARSDLVAKLRSRLSDDRVSVAAFSLTVSAETKSAYLEINNGILTITYEQSQKLRPVRLDLSIPSYNTVGRLIKYFMEADGYSVVPDINHLPNHPSIDLQVGGIPDISNKNAETLRHHIFSEEELLDLLSEAITLHNPNYTNIAAVPKAEYPYVIMKAQAHAYRVMAADSAKRRGMDTDAHTFITLAKDMEEQYSRDHRRQERVIPAAKADESKMGAGDVVNGMLFRRNLRAGYNSAYRTSLPPTPPNLYDASDDDVEDVQVRVRWSQNREQFFSYYEVWRDTQASVERSISGRLTNAYPNNIASVGGGGANLPVSTQYSRAATAKQVLGINAGSHSNSPIFDGFFFWTAAELAGSNIVNACFIDGLLYNLGSPGTSCALGEPLEPDTDYYYRVYGINWNGEVVPSKVLKVHTKTMRAKFKRMPVPTNAQNSILDPNAIVPQRGPLAGGTLITILGTNFPATGLTVLLNGKPCTSLTIVSSTQLTCLSPTFINSDWVGQFVDLVLLSPNNLKDIVQRAWVYQ
jgi:hypothetical protein